MVQVDVSSITYVGLTHDEPDDGCTIYSCQNDYSSKRMFGSDTTVTDSGLPQFHFDSSPYTIEFDLQSTSIVTDILVQGYAMKGAYSDSSDIWGVNQIDFQVLD